MKLLWRGLKFGVVILVAVSLRSYAKVETLESVKNVATCTVHSADHKKCEATNDLKELFELVDLQTQDTFAEMVNAVQATWRRPAGVERWQLKEKFAEKRDVLLERFRKLGLVDAVQAKERFYEYAAVHGASLKGVESRLNWLVKEYERGVRFETIVILSGERQLDQEYEMPAIYGDFRYCEKLPTNETEMIQWLLLRIDMPDDMRKIPVLMVNALASDTRAHTGDTVIRWMNENPKKGRVLAISSQPYVSYQDMTMRNRLGSGFTLETIGDGAGDVKNAVYLDNVARLLFEMHKWTTS